MFMKKDTFSTQMERKEKGRRIDKDTFLIPSTLSVQQEMSSLLSIKEKGDHLICCSMILFHPPPHPHPHLWGFASFCSCMFDAFLPANFFHSACKQVQGSFTPPSKNCLDSHPLIPSFAKSSPTWLWDSIFLWFTLSYLTSAFFLSSSQIFPRFYPLSPYSLL